jgi:hypothetical protein
VPAPVRVCCLVFTALIALVACASDDAIPVSTNYDPLFHFPARATYAWDEAANTFPNNPDIDRKEMDALLKDVANEAFAAHGYRVTPGPADYRLSYQFSITSRRGVESVAVGSLSLLLTETSSGRRVWTGFGQAEVFVGLTPEQRRARLRDAMERMLQNFPPNQRPKS